MRAGELDRTVTLYVAVEQRDELNQLVGDWVKLATVRAKVTDVSDAERVAAQQAGSVHTTRFRIRWSGKVSVLKAGDRVLYRGLTFEISGKPKEIGRREGLELTANARGDLAPDTSA